MGHPRLKYSQANSSGHQLKYSQANYSGHQNYERLSPLSGPYCGHHLPTDLAVPAISPKPRRQNPRETPQMPAILLLTFSSLDSCRQSRWRGNPTYLTDAPTCLRDAAIVLSRTFYTHTQSYIPILLFLEASILD